MQDRIAYLGITFDDVLLEPGYSELLPRQVDTPDPAHRQDRPQYPRALLADGHRHPRRSWPSRWPRRGGSGSFTRTCRSPTRPARSIRSSGRRTGSSSTRSRCRQPRRSGRPREIMRGHNISGVPITVNGKLRGILTRRDPAIPRVQRAPDRGGDDQGQPRRRPG